MVTRSVSLRSLTSVAQQLAEETERKLNSLRYTDQD